MDYLRLYRENNNFKTYVDKCAKADGKTAEEEMEKLIVKSVGDYYVEKGESKPVSQTINVGCGGC